MVLMNRSLLLGCSACCMFSIGGGFCASATVVAEAQKNVKLNVSSGSMNSFSISARVFLG